MLRKYIFSYAEKYPEFSLTLVINGIRKVIWVYKVYFIDNIITMMSSPS